MNFSIDNNVDGLLSSVSTWELVRTDVFYDRLRSRKGRFVLRFSLNKQRMLGLVGCAVALSAVTQSNAAISTFGSTGVVNINALTSGISAPNGAFIGSTLVNPFQEIFPAGTYTATITNPLVSGSALYTAWAYNNTIPMAYLENFEAFNDNNGSPVTSSAVIDYRSTAAFPTAALAYADSLVVGSYTFTLPQAETLDFVIPDNFLTDNSGGVSVAIARVGAVPEPVSTSVIMLAGLGLLGRRPKRTA